MKGISSLEARRRLIICAPRQTCILKALRQLKGKTFQWIYLGENTSRFIAIERRIGNAGERIEIGGKLQDIANSLRQAYIDYIGKLSVANNSLLWWLGCLSEKNPLISKTFLYACYIRLCQNTMNYEGEETLVFIGENEVIRKGIRENLANREIQRIETPALELLSTIGNTLKVAALKLNFLTLTIYHTLLARRYRIKDKSLHKEGLVLLNNWVDPRSFNDKGEYRDNYFGDLAHHVTNKGKRVFIVPHILFTIPYCQTLKKLKGSLNSFLPAESYLTVGDVCRVFLKTLFNFPHKRYFPAFEDIEVSDIIMNDLYRDWAGTNLTSSLFLYETVRRWRNAGVRIATFIYAYENQVWEKAYCLALRKYYPSTEIIGYQHATVPKMLLLYFFAKEELPLLPFPDKVITAGRYTERLFKESGYDPAKVVFGGAIRYINLLKAKSIPIKKNIKSPVILVTPSIDRNETLELVWKVSKAFGNTEQCKIVFKFHPDCPYRLVAKEIGTLPKHFIISEQPTDKLLRDSDLLIYNSTATSIEALALGVPVLHIKSDFVIDRDNLADFPASVRESVSTADEILHATEKLINIDDHELARKKQLWAKVVAELFGPVDETTYDLFL